jgi:hypothetical protein
MSRTQGAMAHRKEYITLPLHTSSCATEIEKPNTTTQPEDTMFISKLSPFLLKHKGTLFLILIALTLLGATVVYANSEAEEIFACVNPAGQPRIVEDLDECKKNETKLWWNKEGIQGEQGPQGPATSFYTLSAEWVKCEDGDTGCQARLICSPEDIPAGGGYSIVGGKPGLYVYQNFPYNNNWYVKVSNPKDGEGTIYFHAYAICADYAPYR